MNYLRLFLLLYEISQFSKQEILLKKNIGLLRHMTNNN